MQRLKSRYFFIDCHGEDDEKARWLLVRPFVMLVVG